MIIQNNQQNQRLQLQMPLEDYQIIKKIGTGKYATVYQVQRNADHRPFALKRIQLQDANARCKANALNEVKLLQNLKHPNIVSLDNVFIDEYTEHLCLILELGMCDLASKISSSSEHLKEQFAWNILAQISSGLEYLHSQKILHRDIKTSNILLFEGEVAKISDLNVSTTVQDLNYTRTGTLSYASPEIWKGQIYDTKCDIWSLGCLMYQLVMRRRPFEGENIQQVSRKIIKCQYPKITASYSKELKDLISFMIQLNPRLRPSAKTISRICMQKLKIREESHLLKRPASLTPFLQRQCTQTSLQDKISCLENTRIFQIKSPKRAQMLGKLRITSNMKNQPDYSIFRDDHPIMPQGLKHLKQKKTYRRLISYQPDKMADDHDQVQGFKQTDRLSKLQPKRLNKMTIYQRKRRYTEI